jgi:1,4-alpha-glucan branching enzyme
VAASLDVDLIVRGEHGQPFEVLGPHVLRSRTPEPSLAIRAYVPKARSMAVVRGRVSIPMERVHAAGFFEAVFPATPAPFSYRLAATYGDGRTIRFADPYALPPVLGDTDLHAFQKGTHYEMHRVFGAQVTKHADHAGVSFAVWAPNAKRVSVIGSFNGWNETVHPMRLRGASGVWELFVPGVEHGELYKYHLKTKVQNANSVRADPVGFFMEQRPNTASIVWDRRRPFILRDSECI